MIREKIKSATLKIMGWTPDALMISGACAVSFGASQVYLPAGYIVGGGFGLVAGYLLARTSR